MTKVDAREKVLKKYNLLTKDFKNNCGEFEPLREKLEEISPELKKDFLLNWHPDFEAVSEVEVEEHLQNCIVDNQYAVLKSINMPKIVSSVEFMKNVSTRVMEVISSHLEKQIDIDKTTLSNIKHNYHKMLDKSIEIEAEIQGLILPKEATTECSNYNRSITDLEFASRNLATLIYQIDVGAKEDAGGFWQKLKDATHEFSKFWNKVESTYQIVRNKIEKVTNRFKGIIAHSGTCVLCLLKSIKDLLKEGADKILDLFASIVDGLFDLMQILTQQMFNFLAQLETMAKKSGFHISQFNMTIPTIKFNHVNLLVISLPIPQIQSPEISVTLQSK